MDLSRRSMLFSWLKDLTPQWFLAPCFFFSEKGPSSNSPPSPEILASLSVPLFRLSFRASEHSRKTNTCLRRGKEREDVICLSAPYALQHESSSGKGGGVVLRTSLSICNLIPSNLFAPPSLMPHPVQTHSCSKNTPQIRTVALNLIGYDIT